jgi:hypothetical protein
MWFQKFTFLKVSCRNTNETTLRSHVTQIEWLSWWKQGKDVGEKGALIRCWWECKVVQPLWKSVWRFLKKDLKVDLPYDPTVPLLGIYLKDSKWAHKRDTCTSMFIAALFTIDKLWDWPRCPSAFIYIFSCIYLHIFFHIYVYIYMKLCHLQEHGQNCRSPY